MVEIQDQSKYLAGIGRSQHERNRKQYAERSREENRSEKRVTGKDDAKNAMGGEIWNGSRTVTVPRLSFSGIPYVLREEKSKKKKKK